jgi:prepilin-type N-terminal cleavage/methylation domain-containing protein
MQIDVAAVTFGSLRLLLPLTIWSCHAWVAPTFRLYHGLAAALHPQDEALKPKFLNANPRSRTEFGMTKRAETKSHFMLNPKGIVSSTECVMPNPKRVMPNAENVMPNLFRHLSRAALFQHLVCSFFTVSRRGINKPLDPRPHEPVNSSGFTVIELIVVIVIIGILAATVLPRINVGSVSSQAAAAAAADMIASDIRYTQEWAMATRSSRTLSFTSGQSSYTSPVSGSLIYLQSGATINSNFSVTFNSLGEPTTGGGGSVSVLGGGISKTITVTAYTGKVSY